jgi:hypothetical protein
VIGALLALLAASTSAQFAEKAKARSGLPTPTRVIYTHLSLVMKNNKLKAVRTVDPDGVIVMIGGNSPAPQELPASAAAIYAMYKWLADGDDKMTAEADCKELAPGRVRCLFSKPSSRGLRSIPVTYSNDGLAISRIEVEAPVFGTDGMRP